MVGSVVGVWCLPAWQAGEISVVLQHKDQPFSTHVQLPLSAVVIVHYALPWGLGASGSILRSNLG